MRLILAGSRSFTDYDMFKAEVLRIVGDKEVEFVISGRAKGADQMGERLAKEMGWDLVLMPAAWDHYGRRAGVERNWAMAQLGTHLIAFPTSDGSGTQNMILQARNQELEVRVVKVGGGWPQVLKAREGK